MDQAEQMSNVPTQETAIATDIAAFFKGNFIPEVLA
jgi:hypothetical protein